MHTRPLTELSAPMRPHAIPHGQNNIEIEMFELTLNLVRTFIFAYAISLTALALLAPPHSFLIAHLVSCFVAKTVGFYSKCNQSHQKELKADRWAAQQSKELALGGMAFFEHLRKNAPKYKEALLENFEREIQNSNSNLERVIIKAKALRIKYLIKDEEIFTTFRQPGLKTRFNYISQFS